MKQNDDNLRMNTIFQKTKEKHFSKRVKNEE